MGLKDYNGETTSMEPGDVHYVALIVYMPETVGNEANYLTGTEAPYIQLGVNLYATQVEAEDDSFGTDYDEEAWNDAMKVYDVDDFKAALANNAKILLAADIDLSNSEVQWTPVGTAEEPFTGAINGDGHTITGLTADGEGTVAMFANVGNNVVIKDLTLENVDINSDKYAAGLVGTAGTGLVIENVKVSGEITATSYAAGIVFDATDATIKDCENNATVTSDFSASGIGAWIYDATIDGCVNNGAITGGNRAGGICANFYGNMTNCTNNGAVKSTGSMPAGGIVGLTGDVSTYEYCVNNGDVTTTADDANASAAGIVAQANKSNTLKYCINTGKITAEKSYAGGIAYSLYGTVTANYCYNTGDVYGADGAGGIAPKAQYGAGDKASYCLNDGTVTSEGKVYQGANNNTSNYYYDVDTLKNVTDNAETTAPAAKAVLDEATGGVFFKIVNGRLEASLAYDWVGDARVSNDAELQAALDAAVGDNWVIVLQPGEYGTIVAKSNITLQGSEGVVVDCVKLNGSQNVTLKNIEFDAADAVKDPNGNFYTNIMFRGNSSSSQNITIDGCKFNGTFEQYSAYASIYTNDAGLSGERVKDVTITNCEFNALGYAAIKLDYASAGTITITNNKFNDFYAYAVNPGTSNSSDVIFEGNTVVFTSNFNPGGAALMSASRNGTQKITFKVTGNTFTTDVTTEGFNPAIVAVRPGASYYNADNFAYEFSGNIFAGELAGLTEATANTTLPY